MISLAAMQEVETSPAPAIDMWFFLLNLKPYNLARPRISKRPMESVQAGTPDVPHFGSDVFSPTDFSIGPNGLELPQVVRLEGTLRRLIAAGNFKDIPANFLRQIQQCCVTTVQNADVKPLRLIETWNKSQPQGWICKVKQMDDALWSARLLTQTMLGDRDEMDLYKEEVVLLVLNTVHGFWNLCVLPVSKLRSTRATSTLFDWVCDVKDILDQVLHHSQQILFNVTSFLETRRMTEGVLTLLQGILITILSTQPERSSRSSVFDLDRLESLRRTAMVMTVNLVSNYPTRKGLVLDDVIDLLQGLSSQRPGFEISSDLRIHHASAAIIRVLQVDTTSNAADIQDLDAASLTPNQEASIIGGGSEVKKLRTSRHLAFQFSKHIVDKCLSIGLMAEPRRESLDDFVGDLLAVLCSPEWPASELLLTHFSRALIETVSTELADMTWKCKGVELLGRFASAIVDIAETSGRSPVNLWSSAISDDVVMEDQCPNYCAVLNLLRRNRSDDTHTQAAEHFLRSQLQGVLNASFVKDALEHRSSDFNASSADLYSKAYASVLLDLSFCHHLRHILTCLSRCHTDQRVSLRSCGLKAITRIVNHGPAYLVCTKLVQKTILRSFKDRSPLVREGVLLLVRECSIRQPCFEKQFLDLALVSLTDSESLVQIRATRLLEDIYLKSPFPEARAVIGRALLLRSQDHAAKVSHLIFQTLEWVWLSRHTTALESEDLKDQVNVWAGIVEGNEHTRFLLIDVLHNCLSKTSKNAPAYFSVLVTEADIVFALMDASKDVCIRRSYLEVLVVLASVDSRLLRFAQVRQLQGCLHAATEIDGFHHAVMIHRLVLPSLVAESPSYVREVEIALLQSILKVTQAKLDEVFSCLWTIADLLGDTERLTRLLVSLLEQLNLRKYRANPDRKSCVRCRRCVHLVVALARHPSFISCEASLRRYLLSWDGASIAGLVVGAITPFASEDQHSDLQHEALRGIGLMYAAWPGQLGIPELITMFETALESHCSLCTRIVLSSMKNIVSDAGKDPSGTFVDFEDTELGHQMSESTSDVAAALLAQHFTVAVAGIAIGREDASALASEVIACLSQQCFVRPKDSLNTLAALLMSTDETVINIATHALQDLHQRRSKMLRKSYFNAVEYMWQCRISTNNDIVLDQDWELNLHSLLISIQGSAESLKAFLLPAAARVATEALDANTSRDPGLNLGHAMFLIKILASLLYGSIKTYIESPEFEALSNTQEAELSISDSRNLVIELDEAARLKQNPRLLKIGTSSVIISSFNELKTHIRARLGKDGEVKERERIAFISKLKNLVEMLRNNKYCELYEQALGERKPKAGVSRRKRQRLS